MYKRQPLGWFKGIFFLAILPIWLLTRAADRSPHWRGARVPLAVYGGAAAIFGMLAAVTATRGVPALQIVNATIGYLLYPLLIFIAYDAAGGMTRVPRFLWWVFGLCCAVALGAVIQSFVPVETLLRFGLSLETGMVAFVAVDPISGKLYQRLFSFLDDQSSVAALSFLGIALSLHLLGAASSRGKRAIVVLGLALLGYALLLTYNMTMISAVFLFVLILVVRQRSGKLLLWFLIVTLLVAGIGWIRFGDLIRNRVMTSFTLQKGVSTSLVFRLEENRRGWKLLWDEPVIGRGIGSTANLLVYYKLGMRSSAEGGIPTDNFYLTTALEAGWIGWLALFSVHLLPLIALGRLARSRDPDERRFGVIAGSAVAVLLIANLSNGPMNTNPSNLLFSVSYTHLRAHETA
ncbi:MAG: O-antigen ligase family protein, partial [Candidatus Eisenbacteria bacterium]|nr:O-antigen ligase family protein [Candidatus Eisenbacteria bacterium]